MDEKRRKYHREYARKRRIKGKQAEFTDLFSLLDGKCAYCGVDVEIDNFHIDHVESLNNGGGDHKNRTIACKSCNCRKGRKNLDQFRESELALSLGMKRLPDSMADYLKIFDFDLRAAEHRLLCENDYLFWFEQQDLTIEEITI
jgi:hypothetical protein